MVVLDASRVTEPAKVADPAVVTGPRVRLLLRVERGEEALADAVVVRLELRDTERLPLAPPVLDVDVLDGRALDPRELLGVEAELEHVARLRRAGELRVDRLVAPARLLLEEVREAPPAAVREVRLVDHVRLARADRLLREASRHHRVEVLVVERRHAQDRAPLGLEPREICVLVLVSLAEDQVAVRRIDVRLVELAARDGQRERRQVRAREVRREVGGRERERAVVERPHARSIRTRAVVPYAC